MHSVLRGSENENVRIPFQGNTELIKPTCQNVLDRCFIALL